MPVGPQIYSTKTATWAAGPALPLPRSAFAAAAWGSRVYVLGGELAYDRCAGPGRGGRRCNARSTSVPWPSDGGGL